MSDVSDIMANKPSTEVTKVREVIPNDTVCIWKENQSDIYSSTQCVGFSHRMIDFNELFHLICHKLF